jgi:hypothetical protein
MKRATPIHLSEDERTHLEVFVRRGKANARTLTRAHVLVNALPSERILPSNVSICPPT